MNTLPTNRAAIGFFGVMGWLGLMSVAQSAGRPVIIDTDPGTDDAIAIMLALHSPELSVRALTVVPGNVTAAQGLGNALRLVSLAGRCDVKVAGGAQHPLTGTLTTGEPWHGRNGLGDVDLPATTCQVDHREAADLIIDELHAAPQEVSIIAIGPLTNLALALEKDPSITKLVKEVIVMGGSLSGGNMTAAAEFNIYIDPEAAHAVFTAGWPLTMVGLDVCDRTLLKDKHLARLAQEHGDVGRFVFGVARFLVSNAHKAGDSGAAMFDPLAMGVAIDSSLVRTVAMNVDVETGGTLTRGETVGNRSGEIVVRKLVHFDDGDRYVVTGTARVPPNVKVALGVSAERFLDLLLGRIHGH